MGYLRRKTLEWLPAAAVSALACAALARSGAFQRAAWAFEGLCRELVAGTTEGRQALVASGWFPPLPTLFGAPAAALAPQSATPWAAIFTAFISSTVALYTIWRTLGRAFAAPADPALARHGRFARPIARAAAWLSCVPAFWLMSSVDPMRMGIAAATMVAICKLADWWESGGLSDLVKFGFSIAALALCGFATAGFALALVALLPFPLIWKPSLKGRFHGVFVLGTLPAAYSVLVWCLMCWLVLGDGFHPLRGASAALSWNPAMPGPALMVAIAAALAVAEMILRHRDPAMLALVAALVALGTWNFILSATGCGWARGAGSCAIFATFMLSVARLAGQSPRCFGGEGPRRTATGALLQFAYAALMLSVAATFATISWRTARRDTGERAADDALVASVREDVAAVTPYGRVFVCGYGAPGLLRGARPEPFTPNLDPYLAALREDYTRQHIFLLVPSPERAAAWESLYWRYPNLYRRGAQRLLFAGDYGEGANSWRLYELVSAPLDDQLREWRSR